MKIERIAHLHDAVDNWCVSILWSQKRRSVLPLGGTAPLRPVSSLRPVSVLVSCFCSPRRNSIAWSWVHLTSLILSKLRGGVDSISSNADLVSSAVVQEWQVVSGDEVIGKIKMTRPYLPSFYSLTPPLTIFGEEVTPLFEIPVEILNRIERLLCGRPL